MLSGVGFAGFPFRIRVGFPPRLSSGLLPGRSLVRGKNSSHQTNMSSEFSVAFLAQQPVCFETSLKLPSSLSCSGETAMVVFSRPINEDVRKLREDEWNAGGYAQVVKRYPPDMAVDRLKKMDATDVMSIACKTNPIAAKDMIQ